MLHRHDVRYNVHMKTPIKSYSKTALQELMRELGQPSFRAKQLFQWLYGKHVRSYSDMTNLPAALRDKLKKEHPLQSPSIADRRISNDGTRKYIFAYPDGTLVEAVGIPSQDGRLTVCFSTQVGCPMACSFCATGKEGFTRNLSCGEIIDQILAVQEDMGTRVTNIVGMGQGEPFLNFDAVIAAMEIANDENSLNIGARKITLSTCGIIPRIKDFSNREEQFTLAVSLHSAVQKTRDALMPQVACYPLDKLKKALASYIKCTNRRVTFEYTMMKGINDTPEELEALQTFCRDLLCHINLIPLNSVPNSKHSPSSSQTMKEWLHKLSVQGIETTIRQSRGGDIAGACGQLKNERADQKA